MKTKKIIAPMELKFHWTGSKMVNYSFDLELEKTFHSFSLEVHLLYVQEKSLENSSNSILFLFFGNHFSSNWTFDWWVLG